MTVWSLVANSVSYIVRGGADVYSQQLVTAVLTKKSDSLALSRLTCDELWVLLVADGWQPAAFIEPCDKFSLCEFECVADAVFLLYGSNLGKKVVKLRCRRP